MKIVPTKETLQTGLIYLIEDQIDGYPGNITIEVSYSAGEDDTLEFEYSEVTQKSNPHLTEDEIQAVNKILECGKEEDVVRLLNDFYTDTEIKFLPNHYTI
jgi:hypothetical protein